MTANAVNFEEDRASAPLPLAVYVHFPWCLRKCPYCDFRSVACTAAAIPHQLYADAILAELKSRQELLANRRLVSVYFGGGTPSLWEVEQLGRVLQGVVGQARLRNPSVEVTVECNPSSASSDRIRQLRQLGVNRLSIGAQSLDPQRLAQLGRLHDAAGAASAVAMALDAGARVNADLIYAIGAAHGRDRPQSPQQAAADARRLASLGVGHLSAYVLTIAAGTPFGALCQQGHMTAVDEDAAADSFTAVSEALRNDGFEHYEISNFARPGQRSRHNLAYWRGEDYLGLGAAAYGTISQPDGHAERYHNAPNPADYLAQQRSAYAPANREHLSPETRLRERIMLGLRTLEGIDLEQVAACLGVNPLPPHRARAVEELIACNRLSQLGTRLVIPAESWLLADATAAALF